MNKSFRLLFLAAATVLCAACSKELPVSDSNASPSTERKLITLDMSYDGIVQSVSKSDLSFSNGLLFVFTTDGYLDQGPIAVTSSTRSVGIYEGTYKIWAVFNYNTAAVKNALSAVVTIDDLKSVMIPFSAQQAESQTIFMNVNGNDGTFRVYQGCPAVKLVGSPLTVKVIIEKFSNGLSETDGELSDYGVTITKASLKNVPQTASFNGAKSTLSTPGSIASKSMTKQVAKGSSTGSSSSPAVVLYGLGNSNTGESSMILNLEFTIGGKNYSHDIQIGPTQKGNKYIYNEITFTNKSGIITFDVYQVIWTRAASSMEAINMAYFEEGDEPLKLYAKLLVNGVGQGVSLPLTFSGNAQGGGVSVTEFTDGTEQIKGIEISDAGISGPKTFTVTASYTSPNTGNVYSSLLTVNVLKGWGWDDDDTGGSGEHDEDF